MRNLVHAAIACSALALSLGSAIAGAQESVPVSDAENTNRWFVELKGAPTADGNSLSNVRAEKNAFKKAAASAKIDYKELRSFDVLFNGYSVEVDVRNRAKLARLDSVKALWPVVTVRRADTDPTAGGSAPDLATAIAMTGADIVQNSLGFDGTGVKVAVMDTGIDYDHADLGGDGTAALQQLRLPDPPRHCGTRFRRRCLQCRSDFSEHSIRYLPLIRGPDDCGGHGSHVAGIVGADGSVKGVAPGVSFGAYRVFGCAGSTTADIMIAAMERALADGMQVLNMSIGSSFQWPEYPTGAAATRLVNKGVAVVASIGNSGPQGGAPNGLYSAGAPGVGAKVIGVASFDNTHVRQPAFAVSPDGTLVGYTAASGSTAAIPTSGSLPMAKTGTTTTANDACNPLPAGSLTGQSVLIRRGTCGFYVKAFNAQQAGAAAVVLYNNAVAFPYAHRCASPPSYTSHHDSGGDGHEYGWRTARRTHRVRTDDHDLDQLADQYSESDRRTDFGLQFLRPRSRPESEAGHRRPGRIDLLDRTDRTR